MMNEKTLEAIKRHGESLLAAHDPPALVMPLDKYLYHMTKRVNWKVCSEEVSR